MVSYILYVPLFLAFYRLQLASLNFFGYIDKIERTDIAGFIAGFSSYYNSSVKNELGIFILVSIYYGCSDYIGYTEYINQEEESMPLKRNILFFLGGAIIVYAHILIQNWLTDAGISIYQWLFPRDAVYSHIVLSILILGISTGFIYGIREVYRRMEGHSLWENSSKIFFIISMVLSLVACLITLKVVALPSYISLIPVIRSHLTSMFNTVRMQVQMST